MSIFSTIIGKIFPKAHAATIESIKTADITPEDMAKVAAPAVSSIDVDTILSEMQKSSGQLLNWKTSIVDLLKLLGLDSSLDARKKLATELDYKGDTNDSATMNIWLHKEVMKKIAANGGKLPADIKL